MTLDPLAATERALRIVGLRIAKKRPTDDRRVANKTDALHEAAHLALALVDGGDAADVALAPHAAVSAGKLGRLRWRQDAERVDGSMHAPNRLARVSCDCAGFVAESCLGAGGVEVWGAVPDMYMALARLDIAPDAPAPAFEPLWTIVRRTARVLEMRKDGVRAIAKELLARGRLTRAEAASIAWRADRAPIQFVVPAWQSAPERAELERERLRVDSALAELATWQQERLDASYARSREAAR